MLLGMIFRLYSENFVEIQALFPEILRFQFVTLFVKHPVVSTGQGQAEVKKGHDVLIAYEYWVTHVFGVTLGVETNVYFVI